MTCPACTSTVQCVSCRMDGRPAPRVRPYAGRRPIDGATARGIRPEPPRERDPDEADEDHRALLIDTERSGRDRL